MAKAKMTLGLDKKTVKAINESTTIMKEAVAHLAEAKHLMAKNVLLLKKVFSGSLKTL